MAQDIASRQPTEPIRTDPASDSSPNAALMSGQAWRDFCARLEQAGEEILREDVPGDHRTRAEGFELLAGLLHSALDMDMFADPDRPHFVRPLDRDAKWGLAGSGGPRIAETHSVAQRYGAGHFALNDDEALLIEFEPPDALDWNFEVGDFWQCSLDFANRPISINDQQAVVDSDGIREVPSYSARVSQTRRTEQIAARRGAVQRRIQRG